MVVFLILIPYVMYLAVWLEDNVVKPDMKILITVQRYGISAICRVYIPKVSGSAATSRVHPPATNSEKAPITGGFPN